MNVVVLVTDTGGEILDADAPHLSALAQGIGRGDGIFEVARYAGGRVNKLSEHLWRLGRSAGIMDMEIPSDDAWSAAIETAVAAWQETPGEGFIPSEAMIKLTAIRGYAPENPEGYAWVNMTPTPVERRPDRRIPVALLERGFHSETAARAPWLLLGAKTLSYATNMAALREAAKRGAEDVIFTTSDGLVLEAPTSSVVVKRGNELLTSPPEIGVLPGTTQIVLFEAARAAGWQTSYKRMTPDDLRAADAVWLLSTVRLLTQVESLDGQELGLDQDAHDRLMDLLDSAL